MTYLFFLTEGADVADLSLFSQFSNTHIDHGNKFLLNQAKARELALAKFQTDESDQNKTNTGVGSSKKELRTSDPTKSGKNSNNKQDSKPEQKLNEMKVMSVDGKHLKNSASGASTVNRKTSETEQRSLTKSKTVTNGVICEEDMEELEPDNLSYDHGDESDDSENYGQSPRHVEQHSDFEIEGQDSFYDNEDEHEVDSKKTVEDKHENDTTQPLSVVL